MSFARPLREYMIWIGKFWESPRLENKTCVGTVDDFLQGLNQADEYKGVLGPGFWRFVAASLTFPLRVAQIWHRWDPSDVWSWGAVHVPLCDSFSFCALPCREIQNHNQPFGATCSFLWHWWVMPWPEECSFDQSATMPQGCRQARWDWVSQNSSQSCSALANMRNALPNIQGSWPRSGVWVLPTVSSGLVCFKIHVWASVSVWSHVGADLPPHRHDGCALPSRLDVLFLQALQHQSADFLCLI